MSLSSSDFFEKSIILFSDRELRGLAFARVYIYMKPLFLPQEADDRRKILKNRIEI